MFRISEGRRSRQNHLKCLLCHANFKESHVFIRYQRLLTQLFHPKSSGNVVFQHEYINIKGCMWLCSMMAKLKTRNHCALSLLLLECYNSTFDLLNQQISPTKKVLLQSALALLCIMSSHITCRIF